MKILVLDNYDSFTYNLVHILKELGCTDMDIYRNDKINLADVANYDKIVLSPGPGLPSESGILNEIIKTYYKTKSILGVCLGHQAIGEVFGAQLVQLKRVFHGHATEMKIIRDDYLLNGVESGTMVGRYHSWVVQNLTPELEILALDEYGEIMAMRHKEYDIRGVQFHPESIMTPDGKKIMENFIFNSTHK